MSGNSYDRECIKCGGTVYAYSDYKPFDNVSGECLECGWCYYTEEGQLPLHEVNEIRRDLDLPELDKLVEVQEEQA